MLRRRRREGGDQPGPEVQEAQEAVGGPEAPDRAGGPWDAGDEVPQAERVDCGSLLVPVRDEFEVQINVSQEQGAWIAVARGDSGLQVQAFAAPKSGGLWAEVRGEIEENLAASGGTCRQQDGRFGPELRALVPVTEPDQAGASTAGQAGASTAGQELAPVRFLGVDGPRWFLRGVLSGPVVDDAELAGEFEEIFADVVVVRGEHPAPPREPLEIRLPEDVQRAIEEQLAGQEQGWDLVNPFERGPEITETR